MYLESGLITLCFFDKFLISERLISFCKYKRHKKLAPPRIKSRLTNKFGIKNLLDFRICCHVYTAFTDNCDLYVKGHERSEQVAKKLRHRT